MSPLKIEILLRIYSHADPFDGYTHEQKHSLAMHEAFKDFRRAGIIMNHIHIGINWSEHHERILPAGENLVERLKGINP